MRVQIEVPATLANLGSGYDVMGLAVGLSNTFRARTGPWSVGGRPTDPDANLVLATAREVARHFAGRDIALALEVDERVPRSRGLGSSATARVAGLLLGARAAEVVVPEADQLAWLTRAEGHPDNVAPALLGGLVVCGDRPRRLGIAPGLRIAACVPAIEVDTPTARRALPPVLTHADAVHAVRAASTLLVGLLTGEACALAEGVRDRLHQPWRAPLIGPVEAAFAGARALGAAPFIGGSGSTLAAFVVEGDPAAVAEALAAPLRAQGIRCATHALAPALQGAVLTPW